MNKPKILWLALRILIVDEKPAGMSEFYGVFEAEADAVAACRRWEDFVGQVQLNEDLGPELSDWPGAYCPSERTPGWVSDTGQVGLIPAP
jgi:hypothetical protein